MTENKPAAIPTPLAAATPDGAVVRPSDQLAVLVVDDDDGVRGSLCRGLERAGFRVAEALNGSQGLARLREQKFDWIVTDIIMPDHEGLELVRMVRERYSATRIIAMSGGGLGYASDYLRVARLLGAEHILQKPFAYSELVALLKGAGPRPVRSGDRAPNANLNQSKL